MSEDVAGFEISLQLFNMIMAELSTLICHIETRVVRQHDNSYRFQSNVHNVLEIMCMTKNFMQYMQAFDKRNNPDCFKIKDLPNQNDCVFPGGKIF